MGAMKLRSVISDGDDAFFAREQREIVVVVEHRNNIETTFVIGEAQANLKSYGAGGIFHSNVSFASRGAGGLFNNSAGFQANLGQRGEPSQVAELGLWCVHGILLIGPIESVGLFGKPVEVFADCPAASVA